MGWLALVALAATGSLGATPRSVADVAVRPSQALVLLLRPHDVRSRPDQRSAPVGRVAARRPITGGRTVLPVIGRRTGPGGSSWLRVMLPGRPNGRSGWIRQRATVRAATTWHIVVRTSSSRVLVYRNGRQVRAFTGIVGKPSTPTPHGHFFVEEAVRLRAFDVGAPYAFALSARSNVLQEFAGGPGQIALHGVANVGGVLGTAVSHGCVRLSTGAISWLGMRMVAGTPVTIRM